MQLLQSRGIGVVPHTVIKGRFPGEKLVQRQVIFVIKLTADRFDILTDLSTPFLCLPQLTLQFIDRICDRSRERHLAQIIVLTAACRLAGLGSHTQVRFRGRKFTLLHGEAGLLAILSRPVGHIRKNVALQTLVFLTQLRDTGTGLDRLFRIPVHMLIFLDQDRQQAGIVVDQDTQIFVFSIFQ